MHGHRARVGNGHGVQLARQSAGTSLLGKSLHSRRRKTDGSETMYIGIGGLILLIILLIILF
jgi:hypothetical protein